jgi:dATP/dGTP diphosphohydrolase, N-terminal
MQTPDLVAFENGATRSEEKPRYDLIPDVAIRRLAERFALGARVHGENNWKGGGQKFVQQCKNHLAAHLWDYFQNGNHSDDNLGAILWNAAALCWFEEHPPK